MFWLGILTAVYGVVVSTALAALFGIDFVYRHLA
jgi:hypothetical protein